MTAVVNPQHRTDPRSIRVVRGKKARRPALGPWVIVAIIAITGFLGLGITQTSCGRLRLAELEKAIARKRPATWT